MAMLAGMRALFLLAFALAACASVDRSPCFTEQSKGRASFALARHLRLPPDQPLPAGGHEVILHCDDAANGRIACRPRYPQNDSYDQAALAYAQELERCPGTSGSVGFAVFVPES
jgi:hypothetical protein